MRRRTSESSEDRIFAPEPETETEFRAEKAEGSEMPEEPVRAVGPRTASRLAHRAALESAEKKAGAKKVKEEPDSAPVGKRARTEKPKKSRNVFRRVQKALPEGSFAPRFSWYRRVGVWLKQRYLKLHPGHFRPEDTIRYGMIGASNAFYRARMAFLRKWRSFRTAVSAVASFASPVLLPLLGVLLAVGAVLWSSRYSVAVAVSAGDRVLGYVADSSVYQRVSDSVETRVKNENLEQTGKELYLVENIPVLKFAVVERSELTSEEALYEELYTMASDYTRQSYGLFIDGTLIATSKDADVPDMVLDRILRAYEIPGTESAPEIVNFVQIVRGEYPAEYEKGYYRILSMFQSGENVDLYTVQQGDTLASLAAKCGVGVPVLRLMNELEPEEEISAGMKIWLGVPDRQLTVKDTVMTVTTESVPCETVYSYSSDLYEGTRVTVSSGSSGLYEVQSQVVYMNGSPSSSTVLSRETIREPVPRSVVIGTKTIAPSGHFIWPLESYQFVSSGFGWRWLRGSRNYHRGLDIAARRGTKIYAADAGTVSFCGWDTYLGYCVRINHGNGIETVYGHASSIAAGMYKGKKVYQGEVIAYVGATGNTTGNHLHFAVYKISTDTYLDPKNYL